MRYKKDLKKGKLTSLHYIYIVNLKEEDTIKVQNNGFIKIGYIACPIEKTFSVAQCKRC